jgi:DNA adenine methylase
LLPFLKWAGGKRWLVPLMRSWTSHLDLDLVVEPFCGSAALSLGLEPSNARLTDLNENLVVTFESIRRAPGEVSDHISQWTIDPECFAGVAKLAPQSPAEQAARVLYLNRTAFNGLWRENRRGEFNVPFGCKPGTALPTRQSLNNISFALRSFSISTNDFRNLKYEAAPSTLFFFDPPYVAQRGGAELFSRYGASPFACHDQQDLIDLVTRLTRQGANVVVTDTDDPESKSPWEAVPGLHELSVRRNLRFTGSAKQVRRERVLVSRSIADADAVSAVATA